MAWFDCISVLELVGSLSFELMSGQSSYLRDDTIEIFIY